MASQSDDPVRFRNSLACVPCRSRHVKCDANKPGCTRCRIDGKTCYFVKSRRGMNRNRLVTARPSEVLASSSLASPHLSTTSNPSPIDIVVASSPTGTPDSMVQPLTPASSLRISSYHTSKLPNTTSNAPSTADTQLEKHLDLYYTFFQAAHPWVVPRGCLNRLIQSHRSQLEELLIVMEFIGSTYTAEGQSEYLRQKALTTMAGLDLPKTPFVIQALLVLSVGVHCCSDFQLARDTLDRAIGIAQEIGMHLQAFAGSNGNGDPVLEESWRRTWWGLYVTDASIEAINRTLNPRTYYVNADVDLPCEEANYRYEDIPPPRSLAEYMERDLAETEAAYSSFAYLIDIARILGASLVAAVGKGDVSDTTIADADGALVNWKFHLPDEKKDIFKANGDIDELLFHAHMDFNVIQIWLHRTRSTLIHSPVEDTAKCAPPAPPSAIPQTERQTYWLSTKKTLDAAKQAIDIFTLPKALVHHTPLVICGVVLAVLAQLSGCSYVLQDAEYEAARNRIRLGIGTLKEFGKKWPVGLHSVIEVKSIAREVFAMAEARKSNYIDSEPGLDSLGAFDPRNIQSLLDEFGALDYLSMLDVPISMG